MIKPPRVSHDLRGRRGGLATGPLTLFLFVLYDINILYSSVLHIDRKAFKKNRNT